MKHLTWMLVVLVTFSATAYAGAAPDVGKVTGHLEVFNKKFLLKAVNYSVLDNIYTAGSTSIYSCCNEANGLACTRYENAVSALSSFCDGGTSAACELAALLAGSYMVCVATR
jgi:hypothetical protein